MKNLAIAIGVVVVVAFSALLCLLAASIDRFERRLSRLERRLSQTRLGVGMQPTTDDDD